MVDGPCASPFAHSVKLRLDYHISSFYSDPELTNSEETMMKVIVYGEMGHGIIPVMMTRPMRLTRRSMLLVKSWHGPSVY